MSPELGRNCQKGGEVRKGILTERVPVPVDVKEILTVQVERK